MDLSLALAFTVGLFSTLHCIGMCGGIMAALSYGVGDGNHRQGARFLLFLLTYNVGRVVSYALAGALMGGVGGGLLEMIDLGHGHRLIQWLAALFMVLIGLHLAGWLPRLAQLERIGVPLWRRLEPIGRRLMPVTTLPKALSYGLVWGWLPCGLVYTMLISSAAQNGSLGGALYMAAFGLGTLPAVLATGLLASRLYVVANRPYFRAGVGVMIIAMGLLTLWFPTLHETGWDRSPINQVEQATGDTNE